MCRRLVCTKTGRSNVFDHVKVYDFLLKYSVHVQNALDCKTCPNETLAIVIAVTVSAGLYLIGIALGFRIVNDEQVETVDPNLMHPPQEVILQEVNRGPGTIEATSRLPWTECRSGITVVETGSKTEATMSLSFVEMVEYEVGSIAGEVVTNELTVVLDQIPDGEVVVNDYVGSDPELNDHLQTTESSIGLRPTCLLDTSDQEFETDIPEPVQYTDEVRLPCSHSLYLVC